MSAVQIAARFRSLRHQWEDGNINFTNYKAAFSKLFELAEGLADCVAELEAKANPPAAENSLSESENGNGEKENGNAS